MGNKLQTPREEWDPLKPEIEVDSIPIPHDPLAGDIDEVSVSSENEEEEVVEKEMDIKPENSANKTEITELEEPSTEEPPSEKTKKKILEGDCEENDGQGISEIADYLIRMREGDVDFYETTLEFNVNQDINSEMYQVISLENARNIYVQNNKSTIRIAYQMFQMMLSDSDQPYETRAECVEPLLRTNLGEYFCSIEDYLVSLVNDEKFDSKDKYRLIVKFVDCHFLGEIRDKTLIFHQRISKDIMWMYFCNEENDYKRRLMSAEYLLKSAHDLEPDRKLFINELLGDWMESRNLEHGQKADAADVLMRCGMGYYKGRAEEIIDELGHEKGGYTVYDNLENVHIEEIQDSVVAFIEDELSKDVVPIITYYVTRKDKDDKDYRVKFQRIQTLGDVISDVRELLKGSTITLTDEDVAKIEEVVDEISLNMATHTSKNLRVSEILIRIWNRIKRKDKTEKDELTRRLIGELLDSSDTCTSGHVGRLVNVLSGGYGVELKISFRDQIIANIKGRLEAKIRDLEDEDQKGTILMGLAANSDKENYKALVDFTRGECKILHDQLISEFVDEGHVSEEEFERAFEDGMLYFTNAKIEKSD